MRRHPLVVLIPLLLFPRAASPQGDPLGPEFRVTTFTPSFQESSSAASAGGDFVVVWASRYGDGYGLGEFGIRGQRFDSAGNSLGTEFRVNTYTTGTQGNPAVGANGSGFVVVWQSKQSTYGFYPWDIFGQRYTASGAPVGAEFKVNTTGANYQRSPAVAIAPSGAFLVVWSRAGSAAPPGPYDVFGRLYDGSGAPQGPEFRVNTFTPFSQIAGSVAADPAGNFIVVWSEYQYGPRDVFGQRYAASGAPLGPEFRVNAYAGGSSGPAVATDPSGNFVVAWGDAFSGSPPAPGISARRFAPSGAPLGPDFRVNSSTTVGNFLPAVAVDAAGNFAIVWTIASASGTGDVFGQRFSSLSVPSGPEFRVNTTTVGWQRHASVASTPGGTLLVTWDSGPDTLRSDDVFAQRYGGIFPVELLHFRVE